MTSIRLPLRRPALMVAVASLVACTDDPPTACSHIPQQLLLVGQLAELPPCFEDPEGEELVLSAESSNVETATVLVSDSSVTIRAVDAGTVTVTFTAADPSGQTASIDVQVLVVGPSRMLREDFNEGLGDWTPNFASSASHVGGMARFHNKRRGYFGTLQYLPVNAVEWVYKGAVGNATENTAVALYSLNRLLDPRAYMWAVGGSPPLDSVAGANYQLQAFANGWQREMDWSGESDAIAPVGELTELMLASWQGELTAWAGATELVRVDLAARGWTSTMWRPALALWPAESTTEEDGFADWVELWGREESTDADWHEAPAEIPELLAPGPGIGIRSVEARKK